MHAKCSRLRKCAAPHRKCIAVERLYSIVQSQESRAGAERRGSFACSHVRTAHVGTLITSGCTPTSTTTMATFIILQCMRSAAQRRRPHSILPVMLASKQHVVYSSVYTNGCIWLYNTIMRSSAYDHRTIVDVLYVCVVCICREL